MVEGKHFSISAVSALVEFYGVDCWHAYTGLEAFEKLRTIHCVNYSELPKSVLDEIVPLINQLFFMIPHVEVKSKVRDEWLQLK